jgi:hypothetical protein
MALRLAIEELVQPDMRAAAVQAADSVRKLLDWDAVALRQSEVYEELMDAGTEARPRSE